MNSMISAPMSNARPHTTKRLPGDRDVWMFICGELMVFGTFFIAYIVGRAGQVALYDASQLLLDQRLGMFNTLLLVTSSWAVAAAVAAVRHGHPAAAARRLGLAIALGLGFLAVKAVEYSAKFAAGITLLSNDFFMFYFVLTMVHAGHVTGGSVILLVLWNNTRAGRYRPGHMKGLETGASYWHMVDLVWLFMFPLLYLLR